MSRSSLMGAEAPSWAQMAAATAVVILKEGMLACGRRVDESKVECEGLIVGEVKCLVGMMNYIDSLRR